MAGVGPEAMKQEQKLVAELYRYVAPFIDSSKDLYLSLDGQAALVGVGKGHFIDGTIPDLWFTVMGQADAMLIEAKALDAKGRVLLMQTQLRAWCSSGRGGHKPHLWVAVSNAFDQFFLWGHSDFTSILDACRNNQKTVPFSVPKSAQSFKTVNQLALAVLCIAQQAAARDRVKKRGA